MRTETPRVVLVEPLSLYVDRRTDMKMCCQVVVILKNTGESCGVVTLTT